MSKKKRISLALLAAAALTIGGGQLLRPVGETYLKPMIEEQLNTAINGTATYDSLAIQWNGTVKLTGVEVKDRKQQSIVQVPSITVSVSPWKAVSMLWTGAPAASLISDVTVADAKLRIVQESETEWNILSLIRSDKESSSMDYRGTVTVKNSEVDLQLANGRELPIKEINGAVDFGEYPTMKAGISAVADGQKVNLRGSYTANEAADFSLYIDAPSITLSYVNDVLPASLQGKLTDGKATDIVATVRRENGVYRYSGGLTIKDVAIDYNSYRLRNGNARIMLDGDTVTIANGRMAVNDQQLFANGVITLEGNTPHFNLRVQGHELDVAALANIGVTGRVGGEVYVRGTTEAPDIYGRVTGRNIGYDGYTITEAGADVSYKDGLVKAEEFDADINDGHITGQALYDTTDTSFEVRANAVALPIGILGDVIGQPVYGTVSGGVYAKGQHTDITAMKATLHGEHVGTGELQFDTADVQVSGGQGNYIITYANATLGEGALTAYGTVNGRKLAIHANGSELPLAALSGYVGKPLKGRAGVYADITGTMDNPTAHGHMAVHDISAAGMDFSSAYAVFDLENQRVTVSPIALQTSDGGAYVGNGYVDLTGDKAMDMTVETKKTRIEKVAKAVTDVPVTGWVTAKTHITGTMASPVVRGYVHAWDGSIYGKLFTDIKFAYGYGPQGVRIHRFNASAYGATITGEGTVKGNALDFNFLGETIWLEAWLKEYADVRGYMTAEGHIGGTLQHPVFQGNIGAEQVAINGTPVTNVHGAIYADPTVVNFNEVSLDAGDGGHFMVKGGMSLTGEHRLFGYATVENSNIADLAKLMKAPLHKTTGFLHGRVDFGGTIKNPDITVKGSVKDITVADTVLGTADLDLSLQDRQVAINTLRIPVLNGVLAAQGKANLDGEADIQIAASNVPIEAVTPVTGQNIPLQGNLNFIANVTGETRNPKVELSTDVTNAVINGVTVDRTYALATMENKTIHIQQLVGQRGEYKVRLSGDVPLAAFYTSGYLPPGDSNAMNLTLDMSEADLAVLPMMSSAISEGVGPIKGKLAITGSYEQPEVKGSIGVKDGLVRIKGVKKPLEAINAVLRFNGHAAELTGSATMGKGSMGLSGELAWQGTSINHYYGLAQFNGLDVEHDYFKGPLNGEIGIAEANGMPTVMGHVDLENTTMAIPLDLTSSEGGNPFGLDLTINVGKKVQLYSSGLYDLRIGGGAHIGGTTASPDIDGSFEVINGTVKYLNNRFNIMEGKATFIPGSFLPNLQVKAFANVQNYRILLQVEGPATEMKLKLASEPRLEERQIISLLTFGYSGGNNSSINSDDANALLAAGLRSVALGYVEGAVRNTLGLDLVNITTGSLDPNEPTNKETNGYYNIEIGKYLLPNVMVTVSRGINNDLTSYGIRYDINRSFSLNGWYNSNSHSYFGGAWRYEF